MSAVQTVIFPNFMNFIRPATMFQVRRKKERFLLYGLGWMQAFNKAKYFEVMLNIFEFSWVREIAES